MISFGEYLITTDGLNAVLVEIFKDHTPKELKGWALQAIKDLAEERKAAGAGEKRLPPGLVEEWKQKVAERERWVAAGRPSSPVAGDYPYADDEVEVTGGSYGQVVDGWGLKSDEYQGAIKTVARVRRKHLTIIGNISLTASGRKGEIRTALVNGVNELQALF